MSAYLDLLRMPGVLRLIVSAAPGRLAYSMIGLATFFYVQDKTGSLTVAGFATGAETVASSLTAGFRGQLIDRLGQTRPLSAFIPSWVTSLLVLTHQESTVGILLTCAVVGLASPPINLSARPLWRVAVGADNLRTAYSIDTTMMNVATIAGPFIATAIALGPGPGVALTITAGCMLVGGTAMVSMPLSRRWVPEPPDPAAVGLLRNKPYLLLAIEGMLFGLGWGLLEITVPATSTLHGHPGWAAPMLGALAGASVVGGIVVGARKSTITPLRGFRLSQLCVTMAVAPLAFTEPGWSMGIVLGLLGLSTGFAQVYHWEVVEAIRPKGSATAAQAWLWTMEGTTIALGSALGGYLTEQVDPAVALAGVSLCLASATAFIWWYATPFLRASDRPLSDSEKGEALADLEPAIE
jgi:MFS family permease